MQKYSNPAILNFLSGSTMSNSLNRKPQSGATISPCATMSLHRCLKFMTKRLLRANESAFAGRFAVCFTPVIDLIWSPVRSDKFENILLYCKYDNIVSRLCMRNVFLCFIIRSIWRMPKSQRERKQQTKSIIIIRKLNGSMNLTMSKNWMGYRYHVIKLILFVAWNLTSQWLNIANS